jgi:hypothetical protein
MSGFSCLNDAGQTAGFVLGGSSHANASWVNNAVFLATNNLVFGAGAGTPERMRITAAGRVGIGTANPLNLFQVHTGADQNLGIAWDSVPSAIGLLTSNDAGTAAIPLECKASAIYLMGGPVGVGNTAALPDGNTGNSHLIVGSTTVLGEITVSTNTSSTAQAPVGYFNFANYNLAAAEKRIGTIGALTDGALNSGAIIFSTASAGALTEHMRINSLGNAGIGNTALVPGSFTGYIWLIVGPATASGYWGIIGACGNTTASGQAVGAFDFINYATASSDQRVAEIGCATDGAPNSGAIYFRTYSGGAGSERMRITSGGLVGIGTASPQQSLSVQGSLNVDQAGGNAGTSVNPGITFGSGSLEGIASQRTSGPNQYGLDFYTNNSIRMSIHSSSGNVGIGTTAAQAQAHIYGAGQTNANFDPLNSAGGTLYLQDSASGYGSGGTILLGAAYNRPFAALKSFVINGANYSSGVLLFNIRKNIADANVYEAMRIQDTGNVGINCTNPVDLLTISGLQGSAYAQVRMVYGNYGVFFRNDGGTFFVMTTKSGDQYGIWKGPYPIMIDLATNTVGIRNSPNTSFGLNVDSLNCGGYYLNGSPLSTGQAQTPWASAIDGNGQNLNHAGNVQAVSYSIYYGSGQNVPGASGFIYDTTGRRIQVINGLITGPYLAPS